MAEVNNMVGPWACTAAKPNGETEAAPPNTSSARSALSCQRAATQHTKAAPPSRRPLRHRAGAPNDQLGLSPADCGCYATCVAGADADVLCGCQDHACESWANHGGGETGRLHVADWVRQRRLPRQEGRRLHTSSPRRPCAEARMCAHALHTHERSLRSRRPGIHGMM